MPEVDDFLPTARASAVHLEIRDTYRPDLELFHAWQRGHAPTERAAWWDEWFQTVAEATARGIVVRRARIVSEPITDYVRFEHAVTYRNLACGEQVRWLPRRLALDLAHPANDCWLVDGQILLIHHFSGDGDKIATEHVSDPAAVELYRTSFETIWQRAIAHEHYQPQ